MAGYTRQTTEIGASKLIKSADLNAEFDQVQAAFNSSTGHSHTGLTGEGPKLSLINATTDTLPVSRGGTGGTTQADARTNIGLGTIATQNAASVTITGGTATLSSLTTGSIISNSGSFGITQNTIDGADNGVVYIAGGGSASSSRGGMVLAYGNEYATGAYQGRVRVIPGTGGIVSLEGDSTITGTLAVSSTLNVTGTTTLGSTSLSTLTASGLALFNGGTTLEITNVAANTSRHSIRHSTGNLIINSAGTTGRLHFNYDSGDTDVLIGPSSWKIWHSGNDGAGSTMDTDLLDGQHGSYYQNASNLNAGTIPDARISATLTADKAYRRGNILGTVSQSGGTPTGAIVERGSNANGEYVRFADGTQICFHLMLMSAIAANSPGSNTWTYPAAFSSSYTPRVTNNVSTAFPHLFPYSASSTVSANTLVTVYNGTAGTQTGINMTCIAVGRWF